MTSNQQLVLYILAGLMALAYFWPRREAIAHNLRRALIATTWAAFAFAVLWKLGLPPLAAYFVALILAVLIRRSEKPRPRYISKRVKRQAIAKWEKKTGETFNRRIHEIDHVVPHARGGGNSEDNLQVLTKKKNRSKGANMNWRDAD